MLWSFAVAQPLFDLLGDGPEFFVARGNTRGDILLLAFGLTLLPPLVLIAVEWLAGLRRASCATCSTSPSWQSWRPRSCCS